jgi:thiol-disulfide isomerase/thioredoxin
MLDFYADWCGPCRAMDPVVRELAAKGYPIRRVNIDRERELAIRFHVQSIPCFVMLVNGREVDRQQGGTSLTRLERMCGMAREATVPAAPPQLAMQPNPLIAPVARAPVAPIVPIVPVAWPPRVERLSPSDATLLAASVRLRIEDPDGHSCGSGTIIDANPGGEALILTCGHLFRDSKGAGRIEVDLWSPTPLTHLPGRLIAYDLKRDVGLVAFRPPCPVAVARVAPAGYPVRPGDLVASVGCNNGDDPTVQHSRVISLDRFLGPPNVQVEGQPIVGRSGGGLFSADGLVIGVCNAADPSDKEGLFAAIGSIQGELNEQGLAVVYRPQAAAVAAAPAAPAATAVAAVDPFLATRRGPPPAAEAPRDADVRQVSTASNPPVALPPGEQTVMEEIHRRVREGAEVVCIVRDRHDPQSPSQVFTLDHASPGFVQQLSAEARDSKARFAEQLSGGGGDSKALYNTSLEVPKPRAPILEWDAQRGWIHRPTDGRP